MLRTGIVARNYKAKSIELGQKGKGSLLPNVDAVLDELSAACEGDLEVSNMPIYAAMVPAVCMFNDTTTNGHSVLMTVQNRGVRNRSQELLNKIAFGYVTPEKAEAVKNIETVALYDTQTANIFYAISATTQRPEDGTYTASQGFGVCSSGLILSERRRDFVDIASLQLEAAERNRAIHDLLLISLADPVLDAHFSDGVAAFREAMDIARLQMVAEAAEGGFEVGDMPDAVYTFSAADFAVFAADVTMCQYSVMAQGGDLAQQGYDVSEFQAVYQNMFESGAVLDLYNDVVFCVVEKPEDLVARCHGIVARAVNMRETINSLCEAYDNVAALKEEADNAVMH